MRNLYGEEYFTKRIVDKSEWNDILSLLKGKKVLEMGCGIGGLIAWLSNQGIDVIGCDLSLYACKEVKKKRLPIVRCDACHLPFKDKAFTDAVSQHFLEHVKDDRKVLMESLRVANHAIHIVPGRPSKDKTHVRNFYSASMINRLLIGIKGRFFPDSTSRTYPHLLDWIIEVEE